jgi:HSP20 family molecular chaperone IbpA
MQTFDDICYNALKVVSNSANSTFNDVLSTDPFYDYSYGKRNNFDWTWWWTQPSLITYRIETPSYPVSNYSVTDEGTSIIEIAVSGFNEDEITVKREDLKIIIEGKKVKKDEKIKKEYVYKNIAERDFELSYVGSEKWDYNKLNVSLNNGILKIVIPLKEECKPINQTYKINK